MSETVERVALAIAGADTLGDPPYKEMARAAIAALRDTSTPAMKRAGLTAMIKGHSPSDICRAMLDAALED